jgi:putative hydrolase of the HAD superfamily
MIRANELHEQFGGPVLDADGFAAWDESFQEAFADGWSAHPEVEAVVDKLLAAGVAIGALSNASVALQTVKLERVSLLDRVPMLVGVDTIGVGKPDPRVFLEACRLLGTAPGRTAYVGDELDVDAIGAVDAGLEALWVDRPGARRQEIAASDIAAASSRGVLTITSLSELPHALGV